MKQRLSYLIYQFRQQRNWTQDELARQSGLSQLTISHFERDQLSSSIRLNHAKKLAKVMGMTLGEFVEIIDIEEEK